MSNLDVGGGRRGGGRIFTIYSWRSDNTWPHALGLTMIKGEEDAGGRSSNDGEGSIEVEFGR
jgi:hypothetical protein